jgi:ABC-type polysaccharide/polyol phosphate transport system ATPase subunit
MAGIDLEGVAVELPIFDGRSMSFKRSAAAFIRNLGRTGWASEPVRVVPALRDLSVTMQDGDRVGLIGLNGSGKTTLLRVLAGAYEPTHGEVHIRGRVTALIDLAVGFDPEATGYENIYSGGYALGMSVAKMRDLAPRVAAFTELGDRLNDAIRTYSAGMMLRLAFATSLMCPHDILLLDEVIGVGDGAFLAKARDWLTTAMAQSQIVVLASHALDLVEGICNKAIYLRDGRIVAFGPVHEITSIYRRELAGEQIA